MTQQTETQQTDYFCYEKTSTGKWAPVVYHGAAPLPKTNDAERTVPVLVPSRCRYSSGEHNFTA